MELIQVLIRVRGASIRSDPRTLSFVLDALEQNLKSKIKLKERERDTWLTLDLVCA